MFESFLKNRIDNLPKHFYKTSFFEKRSLDSTTKLRSREQDNFVCAVYLALKVSLSLLAIVSLIKIGYSSKVRLTRLKEINDAYLYEQSRFQILSNRFDNLFSFEGEQRFMKDQDQMISGDIIRVIWR